eukprot:5412523-Prymnesium_polylepis.1
MPVTRAVDAAVGKVLRPEEKHSVEYNFAMHWKHSVQSCLSSELRRANDISSNRKHAPFRFCH